MQRSQLDHLVGQIMAHAPDTSDIIFTVGKAIQTEVHGELIDAVTTPDLGPLKPFQVESVAMCLMGSNMRLFREQVKTGACDLSYELPGRFRFRVNVLGQRGSLAVVMRKLSMRVPTVEELGLPAIFEHMAREQYGLILVTGGTGTGKSTSLAALINTINENFPKHIITLEDPVEYVHPHKKGTVNQRELGVDFDSFASGLRAALRQAPKVILVGEIRDRETVQIALEAAETGHLVLGTLHTSDAGQTLNRIIGMFDLSEERLVRSRLCASLKYVVSQRLLPKKGGGRVAAFEILRNTLRIKDVITNGETEDKTFYSILEQGGTFGMVTFDQYLAKLYEQGLIDEEVALLSGSDKSRLGQMLDRIKAERGETVTTIKGLELDTEYGQNW
ncbi:type IV pilus twitching motility protein PilT [Desulfoplanes formicivorans]|uniref:Twitching motility protein n=1 Tax=Desulfoplanes formicivorans TaxID=1592317 RepID=A0A194ACJ7_9BACT|nr:PilT/PilU family type 4a pilus ATPase [Desulfoplanes formicivorans]GAU07857.1 twitching motility protein [Desulfoplanes formicivorans]